MILVEIVSFFNEDLSFGTSCPISTVVSFDVVAAVLLLGPTSEVGLNHYPIIWPTKSTLVMYVEFVHQKSKPTMTLV